MRLAAMSRSARGDFQFASVCILVAAALWVVGCGDPQAPVARGGISGLTIEVGNSESVDLTGYFSDPDGDDLSYAATSADEGVATTSVSGASLRVTAVAAGTAIVTVTAMDPGGLSAEQEFPVTVPNRAPKAVGQMPDAEIFVGDSFELALAEHFSDPDGDDLDYSASSSDENVATVAVSGGTVAVMGVAIGSATVKVTATDPDGLSATQAFAVTVHLTDRQVLKILYDETGGDSWNGNTNWLTDAPLDEWSGVSTNADDRVDTLFLWSNSLTGEIPPELRYLSNLEYLGLGSNSLTGEIPPELRYLSNLEYLDLSSNSLTGEIPPELGDLSNLYALYLAYNSLTGEIPPELGELSNLEFLGLDVNSLTGEIPPELGDLSYLQRLHIRYNSLTGEIPPELAICRISEVWASSETG